MKLRNTIINKKNRIEEEKGYYQIFGDPEISVFITQIHSTSIRNGNELQTIIHEEVKLKKLISPTFVDVLDLIKDGEDFYATALSVSKEFFKKANVPLEGKEKSTIDAILFKNGIIYIIEYKDGDALDTKKSKGEIESLENMSNVFTHFTLKTNTPLLILWRCSDLKNSSIKTTKNRERILNKTNLFK